MGVGLDGPHAVPLVAGGSHGMGRKGMKDARTGVDAAMTGKQVEHFVTLFDSKFLPMGMTLHSSLMAHGQPFHLWIICMDEPVEEQLARISLPHVTLLPLKSIETPELLAVKQGRSRGEYCWTITPFTFLAVFDRDVNVERVTYLDADLFFFASPHVLLRELEEADKHVLITEHAYAPEYAYYLDLSGRFCVQFMTFKRTAAAKKVMRWWQERCLEWCFERHEEGKFGDQKYLDAWPDLFSDEVHIVHQTEKTLAPWNVLYFEKLRGRLDPVFYHFQGFRIVSPNKIRLYGGYKIDNKGLQLYDAYLAALRRSIHTMQNNGITIPYIKDEMSLKERIRNVIRKDTHFARIHKGSAFENDRPH
jgi:hypothetical protein